MAGFALTHIDDRERRNQLAATPLFAFVTAKPLSVYICGAAPIEKTL